MTNNPTIDGVSRELLERVAYRLSDLKQCELSETLFAILSDPFKCNFCDDKKSVCVDWEAGEWMSCPKCSPESNAPAVERQEPAICAQIQALLDIDARGSLAPHGIGGLARELLTKSKSTIAQLQARIDELESGRGEPVAWSVHWQDSGEPYLITRKMERMSRLADDPDFKIIPLFTAQPAPVAVVLPARFIQVMNFLYGTDELDGYHFGDEHPSGRALWWRPELRKCLDAFSEPAQSDKYDDVLLPFLSLMRAELHANAHKGDRPGWLQMDRKTAVLEVFYHMGKLHQAVHRDETAAIKEYAADVASMCMMLLDVCNCLDATAALSGVKK